MRLPLIAGAICLLAATQSQALDAVRKTSGPTASGTISKMTATEITVDKNVGGSETISVADVDEVQYDKEPTQLKGARRDIDNGSFDAALAQLDKIDAASLTRGEVQADVQFYKAYCQAKLALAGGGDIRAAGKAMAEFVSKHPNNYHFYPANEAVGDLLVKLGQFDAAKPYYDTLDKSPFPEYKARAGIALGRSLMAQNKFADASKQFDTVLSLGGKAGALPDSQRLAATLGKADCLAHEKKADEGIKMVQEVIAGADPENAAIMAQAYLTLGNCYLNKPDCEKDALLAFLHVDVLYFSQPQAHAEALKRLGTLWNELNKPERAMQAQQTLKERYGLGG
jgi:tetratricopeptide (TPR) repeat protein